LAREHAERPLQRHNKETTMKALITALSFTALLIGGTAAQSMTVAPNLTQGERAEIQRLVPQAMMLSRLSDSQVHALSQVAAEASRMTPQAARSAALSVIGEQPWLLPSRPGAR
jgi:hypothetical protein